MEYEIYHDESLVGGFWHGILLVPCQKKSVITDLLEIVRENTRYQSPLGIKKVRQSGRIFDCAFSWLTVAAASMVSKPNAPSTPMYLGEKLRGKSLYESNSQAIGTKFILFCERDTLAKMTGHIDHTSKVETTFRMGLKGGLHFLGAEDEPIHVERIHFDGHEHLSRHIDNHRIIGRIRGLRDYCSISARHDLIDDRSGNHNRADSQEYDDCQLLQLTDLMVGSFRSVLNAESKPIHRKLAFPIESLVERYLQGYARMQNSRWRNSFSMSECHLNEGSWAFRNVALSRQDVGEQLSLPNFR